MGDIKDFYLGMPMQLSDYAYMHIPIGAIPLDVMAHYNLHTLIHNGHIYVEICCGMYGLPQAGKLTMTNFKSSCSPMVITHVLTPQASGSMTPRTSSLNWWLMTLQSTIPTMLMLPTSWMPSAPFTKSLRIGRLPSIVG